MTARTTDLAMQVETARSDLLALTRRMTGIAEAYDELGTTADTAEDAAVTEVIDALSDAGLALNDALEYVSSAVWNAQRLH